MASSLSMLLCLLLVPASRGLACSNSCSGHGVCGNGLICECYKGWMGGDCSLRKCPEGLAWVDVAAGKDDAHNPVMCSNKGICDHSNGVCTCHENFGGVACDQLRCPNDCTGRGLCVSAEQYANTRDPGLGAVLPYDQWDAKKIYGCQCDAGFFEYDCSRKECPRGDDPFVGVQGSVDDPLQLNEVQTLSCRADGGAFTLTFKGATTAPIAYDATANTLTQALEALPTIGRWGYGYESVAVTVNAGDGKVCSSATAVETTIEFKQDFGDLPLLHTSSEIGPACVQGSPPAGYDLCSSQGTVLQVQEQRRGSKENEFCSRRGLCLEAGNGDCACADGYTSSNGYGAPGNRGDCGASLAGISSCPSPGGIACSGHGFCQNFPTYACQCQVGFDGADCSLRFCPEGKAWFGMPHAVSAAHDTAPCSNRGVCDKEQGLCTCHAGFSGSSCDTMDCPGDPVCSGQGRCLLMEELAKLATLNGDATRYTYGKIPSNPSTWDYDQIQGCFCEEGFEGYDCSLLSCPKGDDPETGDQYHETQLLRCIADSGTFDVSFRADAFGETLTVSDVAYDVGVDALRETLETLESITSPGGLRVAYTRTDGEDKLCTNDGSNVAVVTFLQELGDVPPITFEVASLDLENGLGFVAAAIDVADNGADGFAVSLAVASTGDIAADAETNKENCIAKSSDAKCRFVFDNENDSSGECRCAPVQGTMENAECSNRGICAYDTGICNCFGGYGSSDGDGNPGARGDCGWKMPWNNIVS